MELTPEYKARLIMKLRTLIAVLKVALKKIEHAKQAEQSPDKLARLEKILKNLDNTLLISERALMKLDDSDFYRQIHEYCVTDANG